MRPEPSPAAVGATLFHVDVFATGPLTGNGLAVFLGTDGWPAPAMQRLTQEMKQFESIFLSEATPAGEARARVLTVDGGRRAAVRRPPGAGRRGRAAPRVHAAGR
jgi:hypothetical protein